MRLIGDKGYFQCDYCTSLYFPQENLDGVRLLDESVEVNCPLCEIPLVLAYIDETQILYCTRCHGMLIKQMAFLLTLEYMKERASGSPIKPKPVNRDELKREIDCPYCSKKMATHAYAGPGNVVVDNCLDCMVIWLDTNEVKRIVQAQDPGEHID